MFAARSYDPTGRLWSVGILAVVYISWHQRWLPSFVLPSHTSTTNIFSWVRVLRSIMVVAAILIPRDIRIPYGQTLRPVDHDTVFLLDVSLSMTVDDVAPSRFGLAKEVITSIIEQHTTDTSYALVAFSGLPILEIAPTHDVAAFQAHVEQVYLAQFPPTQQFVGTALGDALLFSLREVIDTTTPTDVWLISDGDNSQGLDPQDIIQTYVDAHIPVHTVAIGTQTYQVGVDSTGQDIFAYIDLEMLRGLAEQTNGTFVHIDTTPAAGLQDILTGLTRETAETTVVQTYMELTTILTYLLLIGGLLLLVLYSLLYRRIHHIVAKK